MASGTIAPTTAPVAKRARISSGKDGVSAQARFPRAEIAVTHSSQRGGSLDYSDFHEPTLDALFARAREVRTDAQSREAWHALNRRDGLRLAYPGYGPLWLFTGRELRRMLGAAGLTTVRAWGVHAVTSLLPSTLLHRANPPRPLAAAYRALRRLDTALAPTQPARALANNLVLLAERAHPSA